MINSKKYSLEQFLMLVFFIMLSIVLSFLVYKTSVVYDDVEESKMQNENVRIARSYLFVLLKSSDIEGAIAEVQVDGLKLLSVDRPYEKAKTFVFYDDGYLWECYTDKNFNRGLSEKIIELSSFDFDVRDNTLFYDLSYKNVLASGNLVFRSGK